MVFFFFFFVRYFVIIYLIFLYRFISSSRDLRTEDPSTEGVGYVYIELFFKYSSKRILYIKIKYISFFVSYTRLFTKNFCTLEKSSTWERCTLDIVTFVLAIQVPGQYFARYKYICFLSQQYKFLYHYRVIIFVIVPS